MRTPDSNQNPIAKTIETVETVAETVAHTTDQVVQPYRTSVAKRYPTLFLVLVTFGVAATFFGFERIIGQITFLDQNPILILVIGLGVLVLTGTLYKKLR